MYALDARPAYLALMNVDVFGIFVRFAEQCRVDPTGNKFKDAVWNFYRHQSHKEDLGAE